MAFSDYNAVWIEVSRTFFSGRFNWRPNSSLLAHLLREKQNLPK